MDSRENPIPRPNRFVFETTLACNLRCRHCGSRAGQARADELDVLEIEDLFRRAAGLGCRRVTLSGGEPMMRPDWLEVIAAGKRAGIGVAMITNGLAFDGAAAREARAAGLGSVGLSVDGIGRTHDNIRGKCGHFGVITEAMRTARDAGLSFTVITTLFSANARELLQLYELARDNGAFSWQVQTCFDMGNLVDHPELKLRPRQLIAIERLLGDLIRRGEQRIAVCNSFGYFGPDERELRRYYNGKHFSGCAAGIRTFGVESNGDVKGCMSIYAGCVDRTHGYIEGNVRREPLEEIWSRPGAFAYNREWSVEDMGGFCRTCEHVEKCRGGCRTNIITYGGGVENPLCIHRALIEDRPRSAVGRLGEAAAALFAGTLAVTAPNCGDEPRDPTGGDSDSDTDTDTGTDTGSDSDSDSDTDGYDTDSDIDTETDTETDTTPDGGADDGGTPDGGGVDAG
jgi:radical SAM protein with 4Fe4S-binding SPASM domain